jgi:uncharacterized short protein YbdD (DUF466 family)
MYRTHPYPFLSLRDWLVRAGSVVRRVVGAPDYTRYLEHMRSDHPTATPLTPEEFARERLEARYSAPGSRCC